MKSNKLKVAVGVFLAFVMALPSWADRVGHAAPHRRNVPPVAFMTFSMIFALTASISASVSVARPAAAGR